LSNIVYRLPNADELALCVEFHTRTYYEAHKGILKLDETWIESSKEKWSVYWQNCFQARHLERHFFMQVAFDANTPIGFVTSGRNLVQQPQYERAHLKALSVDAKYQRKGIGKNLLCKALLHSEKHISNSLSVFVLTEDHVVRKWYEKHGAIYISSGALSGPRKEEVDHLSFKKIGQVIREKFGQIPQKNSLRERLRKLGT
jgi:ribosomal protein S18 acetylase RimI-like enzyme